MLCVDNVYFPIVPEEESLTFESSNIKITNHSTKGVNYSIFFKKCNFVVVLLTVQVHWTTAILDLEDL